VLGFAHLHEQTMDELRGRTFAALFSLMRIGLLVSMGLAVPAAELANGKIPGLLAEGSRVVLVGGGLVMIAAGISALWAVRNTLIAMGRMERPSVAAATEAFRTYRRSVSGGEATEEIEAIEVDP
jgi:hypothetical protein